MCTVTFVPLKNNRVVITSNRDEHVSRRARLQPYTEVVNEIKITYPKDKTAGGTWFAMNENGVVVVLLNGAAKNHKRTPPYRRSRGLIVLDIISSRHPINFIHEVDLENIEPFTLAMYDALNLWEFRWDGNRKELRQLDSTQNHIWSSWTLYNKSSQEKRNRHFKVFHTENEPLNTEKILNFHQENHGDFENGFIINRKNGLKTLSVTQVVSQKDYCELHHLDLDSAQSKAVSLSTTAPIISRA